MPAYAKRFRLWDVDRAHGEDFTSAYCRDCRKVSDSPCEGCPAPQLLAECLPAVRAYLVCATQWRVGMGGRTGLDYQACRIPLEAHRARLQLPDDAELWEDLQVIEHAFLDADAEQRERERAQRSVGTPPGPMQ